jgi:hypothetical protein
MQALLKALRFVIKVPTQYDLHVNVTQNHFGTSYTRHGIKMGSHKKVYVLQVTYSFTFFSSPTPLRKYPEYFLGGGFNLEAKFIIYVSF